MTRTFSDIYRRSCNGDVKKSSGEGTRGGKVIGHTRSGKPIYETASAHYNNPDKSVPHAGHVQEAYAASHDYSAQDHRDAEAMHTKHAFDANKESVKRGKNGTPHAGSNRKTLGHLKAANLHAEAASFMEDS